MKSIQNWLKNVHECFHVSFFLCIKMSILWKTVCETFLDNLFLPVYSSCIQFLHCLMEMKIPA